MTASSGISAKIRKTATEAAKKAGFLLMEKFNGNNSFSLKKNNTIVSGVDALAESAIISLIKSNFPSHSIFSEEAGGAVTNDYLWIIDPLDGTTNYISGVPVFSVSIALLYDKEPIFGVIYNPVVKRLYVSEKGKGFYVNGKKATIKDKPFPDSILLLGKGVAEENSNLKMAKILRNSIELKFPRTHRIFGSSALDLCSIASMRASIFVSPGANSWDVAAGVLMVKEAGGSVFDFNGKEWSLESENLIASNREENCKLFLEKCLKKV